jgi:hypothetical protein
MRQPKREAYTPSASRPAKESPPGYYTRAIAGFKTTISNTAYNRSDEAEGQPLGCIESEFAKLREIFPNRIAKQLAAVPVWIEWDHADALSPTALAVYYSTEGEGLWREGIDPRKQKAVCILSLKAVYEAKSTGRMKKTVILHELAHAVHDQMIGFDNSFVYNAFRQSRARGLYDQVKHDPDGRMGPAYAATNSAEYFAELSGAYLDRLDYFPHNASELRDHDSVGYEIMEKV